MYNEQTLYFIDVCSCSMLITATDYNHTLEAIRLKLYGMNEEQYERWKRDGYLVLDQFLSSGEVERYNRRMDQAFAKFQEAGKSNPETAQLDNVNQISGIIEYDSIFLELMEHPNMMNMMRDALGHSFVMVDNDALIKPPQKPAHTGWHRDTGTSLMIHEKSVPFMVKVFYFLSDVEYDGGCLALLPGSHLMPDEKLPKADKQEEMPGHVRMNVKAGTAVMFNGYVYHSALNNYTNHTRRSLIYNYSPSFVRTWPGYEPSERLVAEADTNMRKMLLGALPWVSDPHAFESTAG